MLTDWPGPDGDPMPTPRFLTLDDVAEILAVSWSQAYALVRRKELIAIQIGGRGQWRVEVDELERFIQQKYAEARAGTVAEASSVTDPAGSQAAPAPAEADATDSRHLRA
ncbi:MAG: DNA-binding protein excisionase family [Blastococcus sp.]|nr:DNA-binding protein excisionase family [Blastococcus sp.]